MINITLENQTRQSKEKETVLATLLRNGVDIPFSCGKGICQTCLMKQTNGTPPSDSQKGLSDNLVSKNYFLPCICDPTTDMEISNPENQDIYIQAKVVEKKMLGKDICKISLELDTQFDYRAGQFINIRMPDDKITRSYSLASIPLVDIYLELHIKRVSGGKFSNWVFDKLNENDCIEIQSALGDCYYNIEDKEKPMLMIGTGTGLAPLFGIIKDALVLQSHQGDIHLYHGSRTSKELYLVEELRSLEVEYTNFHYHPCISGDGASAGYMHGRANEIALKQHEDLSNIEMYVCGNPDMVDAVQQAALSGGIDKHHVHTDAFEFSHNANNQPEKPEYYAHREEIFEFPETNVEMWEALGKGALLTEILTDFYDKVYEDEILSPYFTKVEKERVRQKQYSFMYQLLTGENVYLGDKPRNAHHWMVISDEIFDYRERLMEDSIRKFNLPEKYIKEWMDLDESYREMMVKIKPWDKIQDGIVIPVDGFEEVTLDSDGVCDYCHQETFAGEKARYQVHEAKIFCKSCIKDSMK